MLRRPHDHHRALRTRLNPALSPKPANASDQDRHLMMTVHPIAMPQCRSFLSLGSAEHASARANSLLACNKLPLDRCFLAPRSDHRKSARALHAAQSPPPLASRCPARGTLPAQIPIAELAARPTEAYLPRFRALALFGRRPPERVVRSSLPASENLHNSGLMQCSKQRVFAHKTRRFGPAMSVRSSGRALSPFSY